MTKSADVPADQNQALVCLMAHGACEFIATLALLLAVMGSFSWLVVPFVAPALQPLVLAIVVGTTIALIAKSPIGKLSGAHMNPAISLAFWLQRRMSTSEMLVYVLMQFGGAITACELLSVILHKHFEAIGFGVLSPASGLSTTGLLAFEAGATAGLVVILFVVLSRQQLTRHAAISVALYVALVTVWLAPLTGASLNPARAYGAALAAHQLDGLWPYCVAPLAGAVIASVGYGLIAWLPKPRYHRLNHSHEHANYTLHLWDRLQRFRRQP